MTTSTQPEPPNPIIQLLITQLARQKKLVGIFLENKSNPDAIIFIFEDAEEERFETNPKDHAEFMKWWKHASQYFKLQMQTREV